MLRTKDVHIARMPISYLVGFIWQNTWAAVPEFLRGQLVAAVDRLVAVALAGGAMSAHGGQFESRVFLDYNLFKWVVEGDPVFAQWAAKQVPSVNARPYSDAAWRRRLATIVQFNCGPTPMPAEQSVRCVQRSSTWHCSPFRC